MANETVQIKASGMMCSFCTISVEKSLKKMPGVQSVLVKADMSSIDTEVSS